ncbi:synemin [Pelobates cultripes]|uniref:Synemin n=1 Tax=Pelobates cultripes TaxID=61616 RepID=A0AAD1VY37_PELCU|nr:synemin [Pelobates cultripes]
MIHVRGFGDEKSQLHELNNRLGQYLSRVRQLEEENQLLVEEIHRLRLERGAEWAQGYHAEIFQLRTKVEQLTVEKCEAEIQKENLCQELQTLQELWEQVRAMRIGIDKQLALYKQDLQQARNSQAALEELYIRLQQECQVLQGSNYQELLELREQVLKVPLHIAMHETGSPRLSLQDIQSISLELSQSWKDSFLLYQKKIEEMENHLRLGEEERQGVEEETRVYSLQVVELRREYEELMGIQKMLQEELLRMKEKYRLDVQEYQIIIEELEVERNDITITITERLKEYHELMQVKTGLSLEVAAYRALLEGESQKGTVIWTDRTVKERPTGRVISSFQQSSRYSGVKREAERRDFPGFRSQEAVAKRTSDIHRFQSRTVPEIHIRPLSTDLGRINSSYVSHVHEMSTQKKDDRFGTSFPQKHDLLKNRHLHQNVNETVSRIVSEPYSSRLSTPYTQKAKQEQVSNTKSSVIIKSQPDVVSNAQRESRVDDKIKETNVTKHFESKVVEEMNVITKGTEDQTHDLEHRKSSLNEEEIRKEDRVSVTQREEENTITEPKVQELPVKKERKKREQAKKKREELEKVESSEITIMARDNESAKSITLGEKPGEEQVFTNIPIQFEIRKNEDRSQTIHGENVREIQITRSSKQTNANEKNTFLKDVEARTQNKEVEGSKSKPTKETEVVITSSEHFGQPSAWDDSEASVKKKLFASDGSVKTDITVQSKMEKKYDFFDEHDIVEARNNRARVISEESVFRNLEEMYTDEKTSFLGNEEGHAENKGVNTSTTKESEVFITSSQNLREKEMVADILKHFGQPSALDDPSVTFIERKQVGSDGSVKTEITVQSKTEEDVDLFDQPDLVDLWNRKTYEEVQNTETGDTKGLVYNQQQGEFTKTIFGETKGAEAKDWIEDIIHTGLKGKPGLSVNVEIIEESIGTFGRTEFSTPFHVEEAEDSYHEKQEISANEELNLSTKKQEDKEQPIEGPTNVEEVAEGEDIDEETNYFVSIPDDIPILEDEEEETIKGQIHIEEESQVKYSWQDEFLQSSQGRKMLSEFVKYASSNEPDTTHHEGLETQTPKETESHFETVVIEKEIKIPHEFQSSIMDLLSKENKVPQQQLKGALDCLHGSLPQDLAVELATLADADKTQASNLAVDIKKVDQTKESGLVTIVAEINVSQTVDADDLETLHLIEKAKGGDAPSPYSALETSEEKAIFLDKTEGHKWSFNTESGINNESYSSVTMRTNKGAESYSRYQDTKSPEGEISRSQVITDMSRLIKHIPVGDQDDGFSQGGQITDSEKQGLVEEQSVEMNRSTHHIKLGPRELYSKEQIIFEGSIPQTLKLDIENNTENSSDQNRSIRHIKISPTELHPTEHIIFQGPIFKSEAVGSDTVRNEQYIEKVNPSTKDINLDFEGQQRGVKVNWDQNIIQSEGATGTNNTVTHFKMNSGEAHMTREIIFEGSIPNILTRIKTDGQETSTPEDNNMPVEHSLGTQKIHTAKQIKYQGFISEPKKTGDPEGFAAVEGQSNVNTSVHHIKLSPNKEQQIIFEGPHSINLAFDGGKDSSYSKDSNRSIAHIHLGGKEMQSSEHVVFEGPITESYESSDFLVSSPSGDSTESERSIKHIKLGPTEKSFTFQMDITKVSTKYEDEGAVKESETMFASSNTDRQPMKSESYRGLTDDMEVAESGYGEEEIAGIFQYPYEVEINPQSQGIIDTSEFDKTVQVHRIVHQSSGISDENKVAVVYLEEEEEPDQDYLRRSF